MFWYLYSDTAAGLSVGFSSPRTDNKERDNFVNMTAVYIYTLFLILRLPQGFQSYSATWKRLEWKRAISLNSLTPEKNSALNNDTITETLEGLLISLSNALDKWILSGSMVSRRQAYSIFKQIEGIDTNNQDYIQRAVRMISRAGMTLDEPPSDNSLLGETDSSKRKMDAGTRIDWETSRNSEIETLSSTIQDKVDLENEITGTNTHTNGENKKDGQKRDYLMEGVIASSELIARAGAGPAFEGDVLGIGGLDNVLMQIKRRVWVPLAAPPSLLNELGIKPVRGLLLYGMPGCGKTLLARSLGKILSPMRPISVISGPEIMEKFVGSSEANIRKIFDDPPEIYDTYRVNTPDNGKTLDKVALHVIVMDEFDAIARRRGGQDGKGDQGDAGVARDSVVNQLLAKMDGVEPLPVPTLVIGLTNKRSLIDTALLRPGRFEVAIEVPPPRTVAQRVSILNIHMRDMFKNGRLLVSDAPPNSVAARVGNSCTSVHLTYAELLEFVATKCEGGMSGASLAAITRAAASRALERALCTFSSDSQHSTVAECTVTQTDFEEAIQDVLESSREEVLITSDS